MTYTLREDLGWLWGFITDAFSVGRSRKMAEEVLVLVDLADNPHVRVERPERSRKLSESLESARRSLVQICTESVTREACQTTFRIEWGLKPARAEEPPPFGPPTDPGEMPKTYGATGAMIDLCDWLDRIRETDFPPARGIEIAAQRAGSVLAALDLTRIDRTGAFDACEQQVVDTVATNSTDEDMCVCQTVQCGYRAKDRIIRPQRVIIYRFAEAARAELRNERMGEGS